MQYWGLTDPGCVRPQNQDVYQIEKLDGSTVLFLVCDGMGGAKSGNVASSLAADVFVQEVRRNWKHSLDESHIDQILQNAVKLANFTVFDQAQQFEEFNGMGTTLVAALVRGRKVTVIHVGDSRAYAITRDGIRQVTRDHSVVQMMLDRGELKPEQARNYPGKNLITRALGCEPQLRADLFHEEVAEGDWLLLCSDGLSNLVNEQEILYEVIHGGAGETCCERLLEIALHRGAPDNVTVALVRC